MKKLLPLFLLLIIGYAQAQVLWYGDPNRNYKDSFYRLSRESGETGTVTTTNDANHGKVWVINKPYGEKRCELARTEGTVNSYTPKEGDMLYLGWRMKVEIAGASNPSGFAVFQWKSTNTHSQNYPFIFGYSGNSVSMSAYDAGTGSQSSRQEKLCSKFVGEGNWVSIVVAVKVSRNENIGYLECWYDGVKQTMPGGGTRFKHRTLDDNGNYCKWGAYNEASRYFDITVSFDEMRFGTTLASVQDPLGGNIVENNPPTVSVTAPANNATFTLGETISLAANASDSDGSVTKVNFKIDGGYHSTDISAEYTGSFTPTTAGSYSIAAKAFDNDGGETEKSITIHVVEANRPPTGSFALPSFSTIEEGYSALHVEVSASDPDNDPLNLVLRIDGITSRPNGESSAPYEWGHATTPEPNETLNLTPGDHVFEVTISDGISSVKIEKTITVTEKRAPFLGSPIVIPGILEAENYDKGGEGEAYSDVDEINNGGDYRTDAVDVAEIAAGNYTIGWTAAGEWLEYTVDVAESADYDLTFYYSSGSQSAGDVSLYADGSNLFSQFTLPLTGGWNDYQTMVKSNVNISAGEQVLRININNGGFNLDKIEFKKSVITATKGSQFDTWGIYPNPSTGVFYLGNSSPWQVFDLLGNRVISGDGAQVDLSAFTPGTYVIEMNGTYKRIILE